MKPKSIILVRHGESRGSADKFRRQATPDFALKLTSKGIEQSIRAGKKIKALIGDETLCVYVSPFFRTRETFQSLRVAIDDNIVQIIEDPRIRGQNRGHFINPGDNQSVRDEQDNFNVFYNRNPDGESGADVYDRVSAFLDTLHRDFEKSDFPANVLVVMHGLTLRLFLMRWFRWSVEEFESLINPRNCQIVVMKKTADNRYQLARELKKRDFRAV